MNPAKLYDLYPQKGDIAVGFDADFAIVDLNEEFVLKKEDMLDRQKFSPYLGRSFKGAVKRTISRGETVYENGKITAQPGRGKMLLPLGARR
jgi:allantoinase